MQAAGHRRMVLNAVPMTDFARWPRPASMHTEGAEAGTAWCSCGDSYDGRAGVDRAPYHRTPKARGVRGAGKDRSERGRSGTGLLG
jgi:hypothetical protein